MLVTKRMDDFRHQTSMYTLLLGSIFFLFGGLAFVFAQSSEFTYKLKGRIVDQDSAAVPDLGLRVKKEDKTTFESTNINGDFELDLTPGNYEVESTKAGLKLFLKISDNEPNPQNLLLTVSTVNLCKRKIKDVTYPAILKSVIPQIPAAAQAVRARGEVGVLLSVGPDGKVISAQAVSGHPLLRAASEHAARQFEFETANGSELRKVLITFVFSDQDTTPKLAIKRYECPYRIIVPSQTVVVIDTGDGYPSTKFSFFSKLKRFFGL